MAAFAGALACLRARRRPRCHRRALDARRRRAAAALRAHRPVHRRHQRLRVLRRGAAGRASWPRACGAPTCGWSRPRRRRSPTSRPSTERHRQPGQRAADHRRGRAGAHLNRAAAAITGWRGAGDRAAGARAALQLPAGFAAEPGRGRRRGRGPGASTTPTTAPTGGTIDLGVTAAPLPLPGGRAGIIFTFQDVTDIKRPGAHGAGARAAGRGRRDGGRHRPRDPQPAGLDVGLDPGAARRAAAVGRSRTR